MQEEKPKKSSQVPGPFLGYSLQTTECLRQLLLGSPGTVVSVEAFEDVGVQDADGTTKAIQTKSALESNPIANRSAEWWKAVASWVSATEKGTLDSDCIFHIRVFSPKKGSLAESFAAAKSKDEAAAALEAARFEMWGVAPGYPKRASVASHIQEYVETVLATDAALVIGVIQRFSLSFGCGCSAEDLLQLLSTKLVPQEFLDHVLDKCLGWVKRTIESAIQAGEPPAIKVERFLQETNALISKLRITTLLNDFAGQPSKADVESHALRTYVSQLRIIEADDEDVLHAINSYLRAATNRSQWSEKFLVHEDSFDEYETALTTFWKNTRKQQDLDHNGDACEKRGRRLLLECMKHRLPLEGKQVPDDFTPGSFHVLADVPAIGWHPEFENKLQEVA
jgi:hypothetical protein